MNGSPQRREVASSILGLFRVVLPWRQTNVEGPTLISKVLYYELCRMPPASVHPTHTAQISPPFSAARSKSSSLYRSPAFDIAAPTLPSLVSSRIWSQDSTIHPRQRSLALRRH
ncbi:hypothetical protein ARMSODRAFT_81200 [Armillaria solidipes]|uniref:Uncharacterized protein n=1 Tax=Armillaria solidipes TaxID=1076256 RepID=A0A2H3AQC0_9AGAR|nr:hypothetical protein ARMSODRAFT_81200 [Armillaria solidipes]